VAGRAGIRNSERFWGVITKGPTPFIHSYSDIFFCSSPRDTPPTSFITPGNPFFVVFFFFGHCGGEVSDFPPRSSCVRPRGSRNRRFIIFIDAGTFGLSPRRVHIHRARHFSNSDSRRGRGVQRRHPSGPRERVNEFSAYSGSLRTNAGAAHVGTEKGLSPDRAGLFVFFVFFFAQVGRDVCREKIGKPFKRRQRGRKSFSRERGNGVFYRGWGGFRRPPILGQGGDRRLFGRWGDPFVGPDYRTDPGRDQHRHRCSPCLPAQFIFRTFPTGPEGLVDKTKGRTVDFRPQGNVFMGPPPFQRGPARGTRPAFAVFFFSWDRGLGDSGRLGDIRPEYFGKERVEGRKSAGAGVQGGRCKRVTVRGDPPSGGAGHLFRGFFSGRRRCGIDVSRPLAGCESCEGPKARPGPEGAEVVGGSQSCVIVRKPQGFEQMVVRKILGQDFPGFGSSADRLVIDERCGRIWARREGLGGAELGNGAWP